MISIPLLPETREITLPLHAALPKAERPVFVCTPVDAEAKAKWDARLYAAGEGAPGRRDHRVLVRDLEAEEGEAGTPAAPPPEGEEDGEDWREFSARLERKYSVYVEVAYAHLREIRGVEIGGRPYAPQDRAQRASVPSEWLVLLGIELLRAASLSEVEQGKSSSPSA